MLIDVVKMMRSGPDAKAGGGCYFVGMKEDDLLNRITRSPDVLGGKAVIRGHRVSVEQVLAMLAAGESEPELLAGWDWMQAEDIKACLLYGARLAGRISAEPADASAG